MRITLKSGEIVTFKEKFNHGLHKLLFKAINKDVYWEQNTTTGEYERRVPAENIEYQYEAVLPHLIEKIEKDDQTVECTATWIDNLDQDDWLKLEQAAINIKNGKTIEVEGKKKA